MNLITKYHLFLICAVVLGGCAEVRKNVAPPPQFMADHGSILIATTAGVETASYRQISDHPPPGLAGIVMTSINNMTYRFDLEEKVKDIQSKPTIEQAYFKNFSDAFKGKKFQVVVKELPINKDYLKVVEDTKYAPFDFRYLKDEYNVSSAIILEPKTFEIAKNNSGIFFKPKPVANTSVSVYLVNLENNEIIGESHSVARDTAPEDWDTPPEFPHISRIAKGAMEKAIDHSYVFFFNKDPK